MRYFSIGSILPYVMRKHLFGDRKQYGLEVQEDDADWQEWLVATNNFYQSTQKESIGKVVNDAGYRILRQVDFAGKRILEIGPGDIQHIREWHTKPDHLVIADINNELLSRSITKLKDASVDYSALLVSRSNTGKLPFKDESFDVIISFYTLEHLHPLSEHVEALLRVLKEGGLFVGGIPTEGGIGWGLGRYVTSRRWLLKHTTINPNKLICWEHPNTAAHVLQTLDVHPQLKREKLTMWPFGGPIIDVNLIATFLYRKVS